MTIITDSLGNWEQLGTLNLSGTWQLFPVSLISETLRITTTVTGNEWETKVRCGIYIKFIYPDTNLTESKKVYIPVGVHPLIQDFPVPVSLKEANLLLRDAAIIRASRYSETFSESSFAGITVKLEGRL